MLFRDLRRTEGVLGSYWWVPPVLVVAGMTVMIMARSELRFLGYAIYLPGALGMEPFLRHVMKKNGKAG